MSRFVFLTFDGIARGMVYAAVALALVLIWRSTRILNFAQGAMALAAAYVAYSVTDATGSYWLGFVAALVAGFAIGAVVERTLMRRLQHAPPINAVIVGVGLLILMESIAGILYGNQLRPLDAPFSRTAFEVSGTALLSRFDLFVIGSVVVVMVALALLFTRTPLGLRMRASAFAPEVARLLGVRVGGLLTLGWALASVVGALAALLFIPTGLGLSPNAMDGVFVLGFTAAVVGGLESPAGAVVGGLVTGLVLSYASGYIGSDITPLAALALLVAVLLARPDGLFSPTQARRV